MKNLKSWVAVILCGVMLFTTAYAEAAGSKSKSGAQTAVVESNTQADTQQTDSAQSPDVAAASSTKRDKTQIKPSPDTQAVNPVQDAVSREDKTIVLKDMRSPDHSQDSVSMQIGHEGLVVMMNGLTDRNMIPVMQFIKENIDTVLVDDEPLKIINEEFIDAEKYNNMEDWYPDYDAELCWAATAANMLWKAGYAQTVINPDTNELFRNEDEVFDYFRNIYTDYGSWAIVAIASFIDGKEGFDDARSKYVDTKNLVLEKEIEALIPECNYSEVAERINLLHGNVDRINILDTFAKVVTGLSIRWMHIDEYGEWADKEGGHDVTVAGLIIDENEDDVQERYRSIIIADSDNDPENGDIFKLTDAEKAQVAAGTDNSYTIFNLSTFNFGGNYETLWTIPTYAWNAAINGIYTLFRNVIN